MIAKEASDGLPDHREEVLYLAPDNFKETLCLAGLGGGEFFFSGDGFLVRIGRGELGAVGGVGGEVRETDGMIGIVGCGGIGIGIVSIVSVVSGLLACLI